VTACIVHGGDPQAIQLLQKRSEVTVPNNSQVMDLVNIYLFIFL
jgi:hypothetical protein